jgi:hypothetical protein
MPKTPEIMLNKRFQLCEQLKPSFWKRHHRFEITKEAILAGFKRMVISGITGYIIKSSNMGS